MKVKRDGASEPPMFVTIQPGQGNHLVSPVAALLRLARSVVFLCIGFARIGMAVQLFFACLSAGAAVTLVNPTFTAPSVGDVNWSYLTNDGLTGGWSWSSVSGNNGGGIAGASSAFNSNGQNNNQVAFLRNNATMSQTFTLPATGNCLVYFSATSKPYGWPADSLALQIDGGTIASWLGSNFGGGFVNLSATVTNLAAGTHTLALVGTQWPTYSPGTDISAVSVSEVAINPFTVVDGTTLQSDGTLFGTQIAVDVAQPGWTVLVPAGSNVWTGTLRINNDINLIGAGIGQTIIVDGNSGSTQLINWTTSSNHIDRLSGFTFLGNTSQSLGSWDSVAIFGTCHAFRVDNCRFDTLQSTANLQFHNWVYGVVDHCWWQINGGGGMFFNMDSYGGSGSGDGSWADGDNWGTTNFMYVESCVFNNIGPHGAGSHWVCDAENGARFVIRYNQVTNCIVGSHGSESSGRVRSVRACEVYNNNFYWDTSDPIWGLVPWGIYIRGGTATICSNTFYGGYQNMTMVADYREYPNPFGPWGNISGVNPYDSNNPALFDSGTTVGTSAAGTLVDSTKSWTVNEWVGDYVCNTNQNLGAVITANNATTITYGSANPYGASLVFSNGDSYQIHQVYATIDQPGRGQGDLLSGSYPTPAWPHQVSDPIYGWQNSLTHTIPNNPHSNLIGSQSWIARGGQDYFNDTVRPGWTPLVYPHPLVTMQGVRSGSSGTGGSPVYPPTSLQAVPPQR